MPISKSTRIRPGASGGRIALAAIVVCGIALLPDRGLPTRAVLRAENISAADGEFFEREVRPIFVRRCYECHSSTTKQKGGLVLDSRAGWERGGDRGPAVVPGRPDQSLVLKVVSYEDPDLQMPPREKLSAREIETLVRWIERGAPDPREADAPLASTSEIDIASRRAAHWAWQPMVARSLPPVKDSEWPRDRVDAWILARLEASGVAPAEPAAPETWLRRATFDLIGLPPTAEEVTEFLASDPSDRRERAVERLLASPHFGEKWAQHWLDLVRYAESRGHEGDYTIPAAHHYRDYVIRAFNRDVPYDVLLTEHVAGDLVEPPRLDPVTGANESVQGTGFWYLGEACHSPVDIRGDESDRVANQIDVFSKSFLAFTVGCARCHDHKFDAISTADYYALAGYLQSSSFHLRDVADPRAQSRSADALAALREREGRRLVREFAAELDTRAVDIPKYLLAARSAAAEPADSTRVAEAGDLDPERLGAWKDALAAARSDLADPLYPFASLPAGSDSPASIAAHLESVRDRWSARANEDAQRASEQKVVRTMTKGERNYVRTERPAESTDVVVDYARRGTDPWITVGHRFGEGPMRAGWIVFGDGEDPVREVNASAAARDDGLSERLSGMLRTKTFEVTSDTLWYEYKGEADVFLAVDSHRMVSGPLHGVVRQKLKPSSEYRWHAHNVREYIGHRVHVEFTPTRSFALREIRFSATAPQSVFGTNDRIARLAALAPQNVEEFAAHYGALFRTVIDDLAADRIRAREDAGASEIVNWLLARRPLLAPAPNTPAFTKARQAFIDSRRRIEKTIPAPLRVLTMLDGTGENERVHIRGSHRSLGTEVQRRTLAALGGDSASSVPVGSGRLELARSLASPENPLVARVFVNRVWHHLFGRGIVPSVDDFGVMGQAPTHPELLDDLALSFIHDGWSLKRLLRRLVLSRTYSMSSRVDGRAAEVDPKNELLHRMPIRRLTGEAIRDALLQIAGRLDRTPFGPSVMVHITPFMRGNRSPSESGPVDSNGRRSIYIRVLRNHLSHFLLAFDKPIPFTTIGRRTVSNSPAQPLILLNDPLVHALVEQWAKRLVDEAPDSPIADAVERAHRDAFGRRATSDDVAMAVAYFESIAAGAKRTRDVPDSAWAEYCHVLINTKEFIFLR